MTEDRASSNTLPLGEERLSVSTRTVPTGRVRVRTVINERQEWVRETLERSDVVVERVPINREVPSMPALRQEGDDLVIPVVEEVLVVEKRLVLKEELRVRRERRAEEIEHPVLLRSAQAVVERIGPQGSSGKDTADTSRSNE